MAASESTSVTEVSLTAPIANAASITPSDSADLTYITRAIYVGVTGNLNVDIGGSTVLFKNVAVGWFPIRVTRVRSTSTTATELIAGW